MCDGSCYKEHQLFSNHLTALQIIAYYDDISITNPLGSSKNEYKLGMCGYNVVRIYVYVDTFMLITFMHDCQYYYHTLSYIIIGMVYFQLANLNPAFRSKLESINLVAIFRCNLLEHYSIDAILKPFVQDLKKLENVWWHLCASNIYNNMHINLTHRV